MVDIIRDDTMDRVIELRDGQHIKITTENNFSIFVSCVDGKLMVDGGQSPCIK